jgi:Tol biopolymer transport system component
MDLYEKSVGGAEPERLLFTSDKLKIPTDWSRDGEFLIFEQTDPVNGNDLWLLPMRGKQPFPIVASKYDERHGVLSPNGRSLAYTSNETGNTEVYITEFLSDPSAGGRPAVLSGKRGVSVGGGDQPRWRADGTELFYLNADRKIVAVPVTPGPPFALGTEVPLFSVPISPSMAPGFEVSPDGKRFLVIAPATDQRQTLATLVLNWTRALKD